MGCKMVIIKNKGWTVTFSKCSLTVLSHITLWVVRWSLLKIKNVQSLLVNVYDRYLYLKDVLLVFLIYF